MRVAIVLSSLLLAGCQRYATPTQARGGGSMALTSQSMVLPEEAATLPAEILTANCTACHSSEMILTQPLLERETWGAEVTKMRTAYKANIDERDDAEIVAALVALQAGRR